MRDLPHIAAMIFNRPLLLRNDDVGRSVIESIGLRVLRGDPIERGESPRVVRPQPAALTGGGARRFAGGGYMARDGIAVLPIVGSLIRRGTWLDAECGLMSYDLIRDATAEILTDSSVRGLMLEIDSGGGEASGCFDCAEFIYEASASAGKPVWAHANEQACSAAYAIAAAADRIFVARTAEVGSIGVVAAHVDMSGQDKMDGLKWTYIKAGDYKTDGNPHESLTDDVHGRVQADVNNLMDMFAAQTSQFRGMTEQKIRATQAGIYRGALAVESGLADDLATLDEALEVFAAHVDEMQTIDGPQMDAAQKRVSLMPVRSNRTSRLSRLESEQEEETKKTRRAKRAEGEDDDVDAEGDDDDTVAEADDDDTAAEDGDDVDAEDDDEDAPKSRKVKRAEGEDDDASARRARASERKRSAEMTGLAKQANRLGVKFNATRAIESGMSVAKARARIMSAAADGNSPSTSAIASPRKPGSGGTGNSNMTRAQKDSVWANAMKRK